MFDALFRATAWLVLPLAVLLFAQWPLRELVQAYSREANDLAQIVFAFYMAVAVSAATRANIHLSAGHQVPRVTRARAWALFACVAPWCGFMLWASFPPVLESVKQLERFGETFNPGYFVVKLALWVLLVLALVEAALTLR